MAGILFAVKLKNFFDTIGRTLYSFVCESQRSAEALLQQPGAAGQCRKSAEACFSGPAQPDNDAILSRCQSKR